MADPDLAALVPRARAGDAQAVRMVVRVLAPEVLRTCRRVLANATEAEDAAQESLITLMKDLRLLQDPAAVVPFANRVASRTALRLRKRSQSRNARDAQWADQPRGASGPNAEHRRMVEQVMGVMEDLPENQAEALMLRYVLGYELAEIAQAMQVPVNTVRSRIRLARSAVAKSLQARQSPGESS